tara:strand:+ start:116 stop:439 length:324 start_codon:yes stop_codon:yes gene_type:complete
MNGVHLRGTSIESILSFMDEIQRHNLQILAIEDQGDVAFVVHGQPDSYFYTVAMVTNDGLSDVGDWTDGLKRRDPHDWHVNEKKIYAARTLKDYLVKNYFTASEEAI